MIGQKKILERYQYLIQENRIPQFMIILGDKGSGRKELVKEFAKMLDVPVVFSGIKIEDVREVIDTSYTTIAKQLICFPDVDTMSVNAENALLKLVEEPPKDKYFVLTAQSSHTVLNTLFSRAWTVQMQSYSLAELKEYASRFPNSTQFIPYAQNCYELSTLYTYGHEIIDFAKTVVDIICEVESANAFKLEQKLAINSDEGYDPVLFLKVVVRVLAYRFAGDSIATLMCLCTLETIRKLSVLGVNKKMVLDDWILKVRQL